MTKDIKIKAFSILTASQEVQLEVSYEGCDYFLTFDDGQWGGCFAHENAYSAAESNNGVEIYLNNLPDFLTLIGQFLGSRIELGWMDKKFNLQLVLKNNVRLQAGYGLDDKVYLVGNFQIFEKIEDRWFLSRVEPLDEIFTLHFHHTLSQRRAVSFNVELSALKEDELDKNFAEDEVCQKLIEMFAKNETLRLRFSKASDVISQQFNQHHFPTTLTAQDWVNFYEDPQKFTISQLKSNLLTEE